MLSNIKRLVIDPGHGGNDPGAIGYDKIFEKNITLNFALKLRDALVAQNKNLTVLLTRISDITLPVAERIKVIRKLSPDLLISIHCNAANTPQANGFEVLVHKNHRQILNNILIEFTQLISNTFKLRNRGIKDGSWVGILNHAPCPAFLVELGFITAEKTYPDYTLLRDNNQLKAFSETFASFITSKIS